MPMPQSAVEFLTLPEIAKLLRTKLPFVYSLVRRGELPYLRAGKRFVVPREAVESYVKDHMRREGVARAA